MENVSVPGFLCEKNKRKVVDRASRLLEMMELKSEMKRLPSQISGGQQQKVAIARGLINSPRILFADEPTGALNSKQGENVLDVMTRLNEQGQSIVMVTHDIKAACRANRILFLRDGVIDGVLELSLYTPEDEDRREQEIYEFIKKRGW
jgi:putative ABC transport system ATP-binding protein